MNLTSIQKRAVTLLMTVVCPVWERGRVCPVWERGRAIVIMVRVMMRLKIMMYLTTTGNILMMSWLPLMLQF
jgi:hypothetical protein